ncbi:MAG: HEPN domain-containing protein [Euryarchaeota archaeon]|nr:HEPN domain-containing protein [Euryarchaeota archaeon]MDE1836070.1 HEPN domain-containing protein [Euryarchaeota archaeon]MDE1879982.1 HEPN domain-containing protein [Euryarchaeota archaeon]MDE2044048.1 HEPN domain-containing protein [Thermoplasmata archaeon]
MKETSVAPLPREKFVVFFRRAEEASRTMKSCVEARMFNSAAIEAVQTVISALDAFTCWSLGVKSTSQNHLDVLRLLRGLAEPGLDAIRRQAEYVLERKTAVQYGPALVEERTAREMVLRAERVFDWVTERTHMPPSSGAA